MGQKLCLPAPASRKKRPQGRAYDFSSITPSGLDLQEEDVRQALEMYQQIRHTGMTLPDLMQLLRDSNLASSPTAAAASTDQKQVDSDDRTDDGSGVCTEPFVEEETTTRANPPSKVEEKDSSSVGFVAVFPTLEDEESVETILVTEGTTRIESKDESVSSCDIKEHPTRCSSAGPLSASIDTRRIEHVRHCEIMDYEASSSHWIWTSYAEIKGRKDTSTGPLAGIEHSCITPSVGKLSIKESARCDNLNTDSDCIQNDLPNESHGHWIWSSYVYEETDKEITDEGDGHWIWSSYVYKATNKAITEDDGHWIWSSYREKCETNQQAITAVDEGDGHWIWSSFVHEDINEANQATATAVEVDTSCIAYESNQTADMETDSMITGTSSHWIWSSYTRGRQQLDSMDAQEQETPLCTTRSKTAPGAKEEIRSTAPMGNKNAHRALVRMSWVAVSVCMLSIFAGPSVESNTHSDVVRALALPETTGVASPENTKRDEDKPVANTSKTNSDPQTDKGSDDPPLKEDPEYSKYFRMLKMGLPMGAVKNALQRDGKDPSIIDLDPEKPISHSTNDSKEIEQGTALKDDPEYTKYFRMLKMGLPMGAVKNALQRDGKDPSMTDLDPEKPLKFQIDCKMEEEDGPVLKDDPEFSKYFKMLTMGLPLDAVKHALQRDGKDPSILDLDHSKSLKSQIRTEAKDNTESKDDGIPLREDPEYAKYFKMLKMGLPTEAVKHALQRDGKDPSILDLDPDKSVASQISEQGGRRVVQKEEKKRVRRKKVYWTPIDPGKVSEESIWSLVRGSVIMDQLNYDPKEFETLFTQSSDSVDKEKKAMPKAGASLSQPKKILQVIDGKRAMNGGIILARVKMEYEKIAQMVDMMDPGSFDAAQLNALKEFMPTQDERSTLNSYLRNAEGSGQELATIVANMSACEQYMIAIMKVDDATAKFDCMRFMQQFESRLDHLTGDISRLTKACDEVRTSERLRKMMAMILTLVNQINTGGDGNLAVGFSLDALLKLNEAKAFDKKTSVLQYLVRLVKKNDPSLMDFKEDILSVPNAETVVLDSLIADAKALSIEIAKVKGTAAKEAERLQEEGLLKPLSISELSEQRTEIRQISGLPHYNKVDHITGRTNMEQFALRAESIMEGTDKSLREVKTMFLKLLEYFGEDEKMPSNKFFGTMQKFVFEFNHATESVEKLEKAKLREKMRAAAKKVGTAKRLASFAKTLSPTETRKASTKESRIGTKALSELADKAVTKAKALQKVESTSIREYTSSTAPEVIHKGTPVTAAAAAAIACSHQPKIVSTESFSPLTGGSLAAAAAAAAKSRQKEMSATATRSFSVDSPLVCGGDLAARSRRNADVETSTLPTATVIAAVRASDFSAQQQPLVAPFTGIAAAAAMVAAAKKKEKAKSVSKSESQPSLVCPFAGGGIAAAAAMAALARSGKLKTGKDKENGENSSGRVVTMGEGRLATQVAAAASARSHLRSTLDMSHPDTVDFPLPAAALFRARQLPKIVSKAKEFPVPQRLCDDGGVSATGPSLLAGIIDAEHGTVSTTEASSLTSVDSCVHSVPETEKSSNNVLLYI